MKAELQKFLDKIQEDFKKKSLSPSDIEEFCNKFIPFAEYVLINSKIKHIILDGGNLDDFKWLVRRMEKLRDKDE